MCRGQRQFIMKEGLCTGNGRLWRVSLSVVSHVVSPTTRLGWWTWWRDKHQHPPWGSGADGVEAWRRGIERQGERQRQREINYPQQLSPEWTMREKEKYEPGFQCEAVNQTRATESSACWWVMSWETGRFASLYCVLLSLGVFVWL